VGLRRRDRGRRLLPGLVVVGSHVRLADQQLAQLLEDPRCDGVELPVARVARVLEGGSPDLLLTDLERELHSRLDDVLNRGCTPVLFTSRGELTFGSGAAAAAIRLRFGMDLAAVMARLAAAVEPRLGYLISKGGITTGTLLREGLGLTSVQLQGQLLPGLSLVTAMLDREMADRQMVNQGRPDPHKGLGDGTEVSAVALPVLTFPGNLGDSGTLRQAWRLMEDEASTIQDH
jgi:uncharacterized protein YgbK (DUF1537 family)